MDIQKSQLYLSPLSLLSNRPGAAPSVARVHADAAPVAPADAGYGRGGLPYTMEELEAALRKMEENRSGDREETTRPIYDNLDNRARMALNAYQSYQSSARDDVRSTLSQLVGVDYYA